MKSSALIPIYTDGPKRAELPKKEYNEQMTKIIVFFQLGH